MKTMSKASSRLVVALTEDLRGRAKLGGPYTLANGADKELIDLKLLKGCDDDKDCGAAA